MSSDHVIAGRMSGLTGIVTFCECGLAFFAGYEGGKETNATRSAALNQADEKWRVHADPSYRPGSTVHLDWAGTEPTRIKRRWFRRG